MKLFIVSVRFAQCLCCLPPQRLILHQSFVPLVSIVCDRHNAGPTGATVPIPVQCPATVLVAAIVQLRTPVRTIHILVCAAVHRIQLWTSTPLRSTQSGASHSQARVRPCAATRAGVRRAQVSEESNFNFRSSALSYSSTSALPYRKPIQVPPPQKHYKIVFIKAPTPPAPTAPVIPVFPQNEEKTLVYVLVKKPDEQPEIIIPTPAPTQPSKPEVYFIKYKTQVRMTPNEDDAGWNFASPVVETRN